LACWPEIHRPQALQHVRWGRHRIHITNIGRVMAEINNYVAAGGCRSVNAPSPHPGFPAPSVDNREAGRERTGCATHTLAGLVPGPAHCDLAHVERNIPVVADAIWRIRDGLTNVATRPSAFSSDKAPSGCLLPTASRRVRNILSRQPKRQTIAIALGNLGNVGLGDLLVSGGAICDPAHVLGVWVPRPRQRLRCWWRCLRAR
jgi:hypothetical protein